MLNPYSLLLGVGITVGLLWIVLVDRWHSGSGAEPTSLPRSIARLDLGLIALFGGLVGARSAYVLAHWNYYQTRPDEWIWLWQGGLPWIGALLGSLLFLSVIDILFYQSFGKILDILAIPSLIVGIAAWLGCWLSGCAYGFSIDPSSFVPASPDYFGAMSVRWPTQIMGALLLFAMFLAINARSLSIKTEGVGGSLTILGIGLSSFILSFTRADPIPSVAGIRTDSIGSALVVLMAGICIMYFAFRNKIRR